MALLPNNRYQITNFETDVLLIKDGGHDDESVIFRINGKKKDEYKKAMGILHNSKELSPEDIEHAHFWLGYFYSHLY